MKLRAGKDTFKMPPFGFVESATWVADGSMPMRVRMAYVNMQIMTTLRAEKPVRGIPVYFAVDQNRNGYVYPTPDKAGEIRVRYFPPVVEV